jgi:uncharacterized OB-fold protein
MKKRIVRARKMFLNGKEVKTVVETVCLRCGSVEIGVIDVCPVCGTVLRKKGNK